MSNNRKIRLLVICQYMTDGGAERFASVLLSKLDPTKFDLNLCLMRGPVTYHIPGDVEIFFLNKTKFYHWPRAIFRLREIIRNLSPNVILSTVSLMNVLTAFSLLGIATRPRWIQFVCAVPAGDPFFTRFFSNLFYRLADDVVATSEALGAMLRKQYSTVSTRVSVIFMPIDCDSMDRRSFVVSNENDPARIRPTIISVGRLVAIKRPDLLLDAFAIVRRTHDVDLWLCGDGALRGKLVKQARELSLDSHVKFLGFRDNPFSLMKKADIFVLSSDSEGLPNSLMEAQAMGLPAVSTDCFTGPNEIIEDGVTGFLTPVGHPHAIAKAICTLLENSKMRYQMGQNAAIRARKLFDVSHVLEEWENIITRAKSIH